MSAALRLALSRTAANMIKLFIITTILAAQSQNGIEGRVIMKERKLQRAATPYAGAGSAAASR